MRIHSKLNLTDLMYNRKGVLSRRVILFFNTTADSLGNLYRDVLWWLQYICLHFDILYMQDRLCLHNVATQYGREKNFHSQHCVLLSCK